MIARSGDLRMTRVALVGCDPLQALREDASHFPTRLFTLRDQTFELRLRPGRGRRLHFEWCDVRGGLVPPISGTVEVSKIGRVAVLALFASYWFEEDAASALLQAGVGSRPARQALRLAGSALLSLVTHRVARGSVAESRTPGSGKQ